MLFNQNDCIVFFGDSITEAGKIKETGEGALHGNPLGVGYVAQLYSKIKIQHPHFNLRFINQGISGQRAVDLVGRVEKDVLSFNPNWVFMMIGVNDVHRELDTPQTPINHITDEMYKGYLIRLIETFKEKNIKLMMVTPFYLELNKKDVFRKKLDGFGNICRQLSVQYDVPLVDLQQVFDKFIKKASPYEMSKDRIHINLTGHMLIADAIYAALTKNRP